MAVKLWQQNMFDLDLTPDTRIYLNSTGKIDTEFYLLAKYTAMERNYMYDNYMVRFETIDGYIIYHIESFDIQRVNIFKNHFKKGTTYVIRTVFNSRMLKFRIPSGPFFYEVK